jgi:hypothetical protein
LTSLEAVARTVAPARLDEHCLAGLEAAEFEKGVVGGAEGYGHAGGGLEVESFRDRPGGRRRRGDNRCVGAVRYEGDDSLADGAVGDVDADLADGAGALVADDVGS